MFISPAYWLKNYFEDYSMEILMRRSYWDLPGNQKKGLFSLMCLSNLCNSEGIESSYFQEMAMVNVKPIMDLVITLQE